MLGFVCQACRPTAGKKGLHVICLIPNFRMHDVNFFQLNS